MAIALLWIALPGSGAFAEQPALLLGEPLRVGISESPPFAMRAGSGGDWRGLSVELWRRVADELSLDFEWVEMPKDELMSRAEAGDLDVVLTSTVSSEAEAGLDFGPIYHVGSLGVARAYEDDLQAILARLLSTRFLRVSAGLAVLLFVVGVVIWALERRSNEEEFARAPGAGIWSGFWWAGVTMTTIGYGDKAPRTIAGRTLALVWMLLAMAITASLTASVTSALMSGAGGRSLEIAAELRGAEVGTLDASPATRYLESEGIRYRELPDARAGLSALERNEIEFFVASAALLRYTASRLELGWIRVSPLPGSFERYAFAVPERSGFLEPLSRAVLGRIQDPAWSDLEERFLPDRTSR